MGGFYANHTICSDEVATIVQQLSKDDIYVSRPEGKCVVLFDRTSEDQDEGYVESFGNQLSAGRSASVLSVILHDDSILLYWLSKNGKTIDSYHSNPNYFTDGPPLPPQGGDVDALQKSFGPCDAEKLTKILRGDDIAFESERHAEMVKMLRLPLSAIHGSYSGIAEGYFPEGYTAESFEKFPKQD